MQNGKPTQVFGGICFVLLGCMFLCLGFSQLVLDREFEGNVGRSSATIEKLWISSGGKGGANYEVRYRYSPGDGQIEEGNSTVARSTYLQMREGAQVPLKFLPADSTQSRIDLPGEDEWHWRNDLIVTVFALVFTAIGAWVAWLGWRAIG